jgi:FkbM family methyltransferase
MITNDLIYDIGMHRGSDAEFYLKKGFRVVAVEANPDLCASAAERLSAYIANGALTILNVGIHNTRGTFEFFANREKDDWSSFIESVGRRRGHVDVLEIECVTLNDILSKHGVPYYLKVDIEGHDQVCIDSLADAPNKPKYVSVEATAQEFPTQMTEWGYTRFKMISQVWNMDLSMVFPPKEGLFVEELMTGHHSGPFGEETYGPWLSREAFEAERQRIINHQFSGSLHERIGCPEDVFLNSWWDFHAARDE